MPNQQHGQTIKKFQQTDHIQKKMRNLQSTRGWSCSQLQNILGSTSMTCRMKNTPTGEAEDTSSRRCDKRTFTAWKNSTQHETTSQNNHQGKQHQPWPGCSQKHPRTTKTLAGLHKTQRIQPWPGWIWGKTFPSQWWMKTLITTPINVWKWSQSH